MRRPAIALWLTLLSLYVASSSQAEPQQPPASSAVGGAVKPSSRESVQQKLMLVKMTLNNPSSPVQRAIKSPDAAIKQRGADVLAAYDKADAALKSGDVAGSEKLLDQVFGMVSALSSQVPDTARMEAEQQSRYAELSGKLKELQETFQKMRKDKSSALIDTNLDRIASLSKQAQSFVTSRNFKDAIPLLDKAYNMGISDLNKVMGSAVISYENKFKSPAEEFDFELRSFAEYEKLIPIAHNDLKPTEAILKVTEKLEQDSRAKRDLAKQQAAKGDHATAVLTLQDAIKQLKNALRTMGLTIPE